MPTRTGCTWNRGRAQPEQIGTGSQARRIHRVIAAEARRRPCGQRRGTPAPQHAQTRAPVSKRGLTSDLSGAPTARANSLRRAAKQKARAGACNATERLTHPPRCPAGSVGLACARLV
jgi:hypothetical protein